uniref:Uncharacterized protein n=1 Tax=Tanacetum cinerariifolium TaxID=118510 RepID=A0A6L2MUD8_TANCI|nr:hypothetical protein [Tanacetum cinerariifolium]
MPVFDLNQPASSLSEEDDVAASNLHVVSISSSINTGSIIHHEFIDTPGGLVYWVPRVSASVLLVLRIVYDSLHKCIGIYRKYASEAGFDPKKNDRQVRSSNFRVFGCKAVDYEHLSKAERKLTYTEQLFIIKAANANIDAVRAHNLYTGLKCSSLLVRGTQTDFKNFTCGVNYFIGDIDAQMLIISMEDMQEFTKDFSFDYFVEDAELCGLFWADEALHVAYHAEDPIQDRLEYVYWSEEFEDRWNKLMEEFNLVNHKWLSKMYCLRSSWIPTFFVDSPLCGLMRSTSRRTCPDKNNVDVLYPAVVVPGGSDHVDGGLRDGAFGSVSV